MPEQPCPACGAQYDTTVGAKFCPKCGAALPEAPPAEAPPAESVLDVTVEPEAPPPVEAPAPLVVEVAATPKLTPVVPAAPAAPPDQVPCPHCGEMLYTTEKICWKCGNSAEAAAPAAAPAPPSVPAAVPLAPGIPAAPVPPLRPPPSAVLPPPPSAVPPPMPFAVPPPPPAPGIIGPPPTPGYTPGPIGPMPGTTLSPEAQTAGYWALGLGIGSVVMCPIAGPFAIWMGARAYKLGNTAMGVIGFVCGGLGVLGLLFILGGAILWIVSGASQH